MGIQTYASQAGRINEIKGEMLRIAEPIEVLTLGCTMKKMPLNKGDNITYRSRIPTGGTAATSQGMNRWSITAAAHQVQEGVTPKAEVLEYRDVNVQIGQYACLYSYTDKAAMFHEDDIPGDQMTQVAERMPLVREMLRYGVMKAATTVSFIGSSQARGSVNGAVTYNALSGLSRVLLGNHGKMKTKILAPGPAYDTSAIEAGFVVFCHTDCEHDIRALIDFVPVAKYANRTPLNEYELGSMGRYRFVVSPELAPYAGAGAAVASTGMKATGGYIDVYPMIVCAEDAVFDLALNTNFDVTHQKANVKTKEDPFGQRGYVGAMFWSAALVANPGWLGVIECGVSDLG